jgi:hypothetical protein
MVRVENARDKLESWLEGSPNILVLADVISIATQVQSSPWQA